MKTVFLLTLAVLCTALQAQDPAAYVSAGEWRQWGGPNRNFRVDSPDLADSWPESGPEVLWSRDLGLGHSSIAYDEGRLFTMYRAGDAAATRGPWAGEETVIALDAATGETLWEYTYDSEPMNFNFGAGPHATPAVAGDLVIAMGTNKQIHALNKETGDVVWSHDLVADYGAPPGLVRASVKAGYACNPVFYKDMLILSAGGEGQAVMAFRVDSGEVVWRSGDFLQAQAAPILIDVDGETQVAVLGGETVNGLNPDTGEVLWSYPHPINGDMNNTMPVWTEDNVLLVTSAYDSGARALRISRDENGSQAEELWFTSRLRVHFSNTLLLGNYLYGTSGDFGPAFMAALDIDTGEVVWQDRGFGRSSMLYADGKEIVMDESGELVLARLSPEGVEEISRAKLFDTTSWTAPTLVGTKLYARDRAKIMALELGVE